ncbi:hypothetical protein KI387_037652, partial [Taxus chinensis]
IKFPTESSTSSFGEIEVDSVAPSTGLVAQIMDKISTEAQTLEIAEAIVRTILSSIWETDQIFIILLMTAYALDRYGTVTANVEEFTELLFNIAEVTRHLKNFWETMPEQIDKLWKAVNVVAVGAFMCSHYIAEGEASKLRRGN